MAGHKSSVFFAVNKVREVARSVNPEMEHTLERTDFEKKHPRDWHFVNRVTGTPAVKLEAGDVADSHSFPKNEV